MTKTIAILCSDLHFSERPPVARSAEPDWFAAQERAWDEICSEADEMDVPILIAGDLFDHWKAPPSVITFAMKMFEGTQIYAVPGQHDLPNHSLEEMNRSAYGTLVEAQVIEDLSKRAVTHLIDPMNEESGRIRILGFPWGREIHELEGREDYQNDNTIYVCLAHKFVWQGSDYGWAPNESHFSEVMKSLRGYDVAVFGDNHGSFLVERNGLTIFNCGSMMARRSDERNYVPKFGILMSDGRVVRQGMDTSKDEWLEPDQVIEQIADEFNVGGLADELESLGVDSLDFAAVLEQEMRKRETSDSVRQLVKEVLDGYRNNN